MRDVEMIVNAYYTQISGKDTSLCNTIENVILEFIDVLTLLGIGV